MTYWLYHLIFTLPVIGLLLFVVRQRLRLAHWICLVAVAAIAFLFTTPWDNYAVYLGIWGFGEGVSIGYPWGGRATDTVWLGHIPLEEYAFFIIETVLVCLVAVFFLKSSPGPDRG